MQYAIRLAERAERQDEVPVGAIVVYNDQCIGEGWNQSIQHHDATAHAEIMAIRQAGQRIGNYRLINSTLYVTLEPCMMCLGAIAHARIKQLVFGAYDPKRGAVCNALNIDQTDFLNHRIVWTGGILESECASQLTDFFRKRR
jgi:tRNA(adenine34) deaminase